MKKVKKTKAGICPICGNKKLEYLETNYTDDSVGYEFVCHKCFYTGTEWYNLIYDVTVAR